MAEVEIVENKDSAIEQFAKWIVEKTSGGTVVTEKQCANYITSVREGICFEKDVKNWVSRARKYAYSHLSQFIIKERERGWRVAIGSDERENTCGRILHTTAKHMDTSVLAMNALKKHEIINLAKKMRAARRLGKVIEESGQIRIDFEEQYIKLTEKIAERMEANGQNNQIKDR